MAAFPNQQQLQLKFQLQLQQQQQQQQQQQSKPPFSNFDPIGGQIFDPMAFFNPAEQSHPSYVHVMGLAPGSVLVAAEGGLNGWEPRRKRPKEQELLENSQITSVDFLQQQAAGSVSTGLGLSLDDRRLASSSGDSPLHLLPMVDDVFDREVQRMDAEMDRFIKLQSERLRQSILEKVQAKQFQTLASVEEKILRKIREKESEVEDINKKNMELEEQMRKLSDEVGTWQHRAKYHGDMIASLRLNLQQLYAQTQDNINREGCGDSEVDDAASCCKGGAINFQLLCKENKDMKDSMTCKVCGVNEVCMLLLPCRHLCLCRDCEGKLSFCPLCQSSKFIGMEIFYM